MSTGWFKCPNCEKGKLKILTGDEKIENLDLECLNGPECRYVSSRRGELWKLCGCGDDDSEKVLLELLRLQGCSKNYEERLAFIKATKPELLLEIILNFMDNSGLLDHGSNINWSWLTDHGKEVLRSYEVHPIPEETT